MKDAAELCRGLLLKARSDRIAMQAEFSRRYAVSPRSLQEWEQGRRRPESAVRAYLTVIDKTRKR